MKAAYRLLSLLNDDKAIRRGPKAVGKRMVRKAVRRALARLVGRLT
jgi:hypothetical protein